MTPNKRTPRKAKPVDYHARGARVVSVFGPFNASALVVMPTDVAAELFPNHVLGDAGRSSVVGAVERDLEEIRKRSVDLADSALAATALALAYELEHPFNSATSKSMCARALIDAMARLRELSPPKEREKDVVDQLADKRTQRRAGVAKAADLSRS